MITYMLRRILQAIAALWVVVTIVFALLKMMPGSLARIVLGRQAYPANVAAFNHANGLDRSVFFQYERFLVSLVHGQLTFAPAQVNTVSDTIADYAYGASLSQLAQIPLKNTMILLLLSLLIATPIGMTVGAWLAVRRGPQVVTTAVRVSAITLYVFPSFLLAPILVQVFSFQLRWFPSNVPAWNIGDVLSEPSGLVLPVMTITVANAAVITRFAEASTLNCIEADYVRTALAKGNSMRGVVFRHVVRNSAVTMLTLLETRLAMMLSLIIPVEVFFNYPGIGAITWGAAMGYNAYTVLGAIVLVSIVVLALSLVVDVLYVAIDPRIRHVGEI